MAKETSLKLDRECAQWCTSILLHLKLNYCLQQNNWYNTIGQFDYFYNKFSQGNFQTSFYKILQLFKLIL